MLWPDDQLLVQHDRALAGLSLVLDPDALTNALRSRVPGVGIAAAHVNYVRYKPATSCLVSIGLDTDVGAVDLYAAAYPPGQSEKLRKDTASAVASPLGPGAIVLGEHSVVVHIFPNDVRLRSLRRLGESESRRDLLSKLFPSDPCLWDATPTRLAYKPQRRFVAKVSCDGVPQAVLKFHTTPAYRIATRNAKLIRSTETLAVPRRRGRSTRHSITVYRWIDATPLIDLAVLDESMLQRIAAALAQLHQQDARELPLIGRAGEATRLRAMGSAVGALLPQLRERARMLVQRLIDSYPQPQLITTIHGDFHAKQVLLTRRKVAILDLDEAARSSPVADLGNFIAHLDRRALEDGEAHKTVQSVGETLAVAYRDASGLGIDCQELAWHTAAALMRLAPHLFRAREPNWGRRTAALLDRVEQILGECEGPQSRLFIAAPLVEDPMQVCDDARLGPFVRQALDPAFMEEEIAAQLGNECRVHVARASVMRHKPLRRCLIEYDARIEDGDRPALLRAVGKVRAKGADAATYRLLAELRRCGFDDDAPDGVAVPQPVALIEQAGLWLQRRVPGTPATALLGGPDGRALGARIAEAMVKLHRAAVPARRRHILEDELRILRDRLDEVCKLHPQWSARLDDIFAACTSLAATLPRPRMCPIHRDLYPDHVLVDGRRLWLLDFDLYAESDPALDAGNFIAHITEQSLRETGDPESLLDVENALENRFIELTGESLRPAVRAYALLTLVRHIAISVRILQRRHVTQPLIRLCEQRLLSAQPA